MQPVVRPRRSILYMPGSNARALEKGRVLPADGLIFDLEDAVTPLEKVEARNRVVQVLEQGGYGHREIIVRVNGLSTEWGADDVMAIARTDAHAILIPKVETAGMVQATDQLMTAANASEGMAIWSMMETPLGMLHAEEIAQSSRRMQCFVMGTSDLAKDMHCAHTRERLPMITSLGLCMLAARGYGLSIVDGVHLNLADDQGFAYACEQGRDMGFDGKTLIHPKTIEKANEVFAPDEEEVSWSRRIIAAFDAAAVEGKGVVVVDGRLVENLHVEAARQRMALVQAIQRSK